jgi:hypothetical protein
MKNKGEILAVVLKNFKECYFFLHNTKDIHNVENILNEGFMFENQLAYSTDRINPNDPVEITYFFIQRKEYGSYTIVIAIPKSIYEQYSAASKKNHLDIEDVMTITEPFFGENDELIYTLSPKHILGYFNLKTCSFNQNIHWDPLFDNCLSGPIKKKLVRPAKE